MLGRSGGRRRSSGARRVAVVGRGGLGRGGGPPEQFVREMNVGYVALVVLFERRLVESAELLALRCERFVGGDETEVGGPVVAITRTKSESFDSS